MRDVRAWLVIAVCATGCASSPSGYGPGDDASPEGGLDAAGDAGAGIDATADSHGGDAPGAPDSGVADGGVADGGLADGGVADAGGDSSVDAPAEATVDAGPPPTGLTWPPTQIFPTFAPVAALDVINISSLPDDQRTLVVTVQGLVNRTTPRVYATDGSTASNLWLSEINVPTTSVTAPFALVTKYASEIAGIVITDDAVPDTLNLACTIAGLQGGIVASPALATTLSAAPYKLATLADLRTNHFATNLDVYQYELDHYAPQATHRLIVGLTPSIKDHLRDYAVATKAMMVWLDPTKATEKAMLGKFLALLSPNSPYMGWWTSEPDGVQTAATYGVPVYAADWSMNLTVLGGTPRGSKPPALPPPPPLENKLYVAIFMSDGDNLQEDEGLVPLKWADSSRGGVPVSWTLSPALVDVAPVILRYYQRTGTVNDALVSGPSGLGYTYPAGWPAATFDQYAKVSGGYLDAAGFRVVTLWNNGVDLSAANAQSYASNAPNLLGLTIQDESVATQIIAGSLPLERMALSYGGDEATLESGIDGVLKGYDGSKPVFAAVQGDMNQGTIQPTAFAAVQSHYATNTNVVFVRADQFFQLLPRAVSPAQHRVFSGDFNGDGKTDSLFYYAGDGNWWMGLSDGTQLTWSNAGNVSGFGNLLDGGHALFTGDFNGDKKTDVAFYASGDGNWWVGLSSGSALTWSKVATTTGFGNLLDGKHRAHAADYDGDGKTDVSVYSSADGSWQIGLSSGTSITWSPAGSTSGFGNLLDGSHAVYDGDFDGDGKQDVLFFYNGDSNLWLGRCTGTTFSWTQAGNESGFGNLIDRSHRLLTGDFDGDHKTDLLFFYAGDSNWWLGLSSGTGFTWKQAANTKGAGDFSDWNHRLFTADVDGDGKLDVVGYDAGSGDWTVGRSAGQSLAFSVGAAGNTSGYGDIFDPSRLLWFGDYDGDGKSEPLFYYSGDGNWWMSHSSGTAFTWHKAAGTSGFGDLTR